MFADLVTLTVVSLTAIFFVVDPLSAVPFFLAMTRDASAEQRRQTALRASLTAGVVLATFAVAGSFIFRVLGISIGAFKIAGGVVLLLVGDVAFGPKSRWFAAGCADNTGRIWPTPQPVAGSPAQITAWIETITGYRLAEDGTTPFLSADEWRARRADLQTLGGEPLPLGGTR